MNIKGEFIMDDEDEKKRQEQEEQEEWLNYQEYINKK